LLYFKERYVAEDHPARPQWKDFSEKLRKLGLTENMGFGPSKQEFLVLLEKEGLTMSLEERGETKGNES
jgi:hypothetical protein